MCWDIGPFDPPPTTPHAKATYASVGIFYSNFFLLSSLKSYIINLKS